MEVTFEGLSEKKKTENYNWREDCKPVTDFGTRTGRVNVRVLLHYELRRTLCFSYFIYKKRLLVLILMTQFQHFQEKQLKRKDYIKVHISD